MVFRGRQAPLMIRRTSITTTYFDEEVLNVVKLAVTVLTALLHDQMPVLSAFKAKRAQV